MLLALLICSDDDCEAVYEAWGDLEELEALSCDCGCTLQVVRLTNADEDTRGVELQYVG